MFLTRHNESVWERIDSLYSTELNESIHTQKKPTSHTTNKPALTVKGAFSFILTSNLFEFETRTKRET